MAQSRAVYMNKKANTRYVPSRIPQILKRGLLVVGILAVFIIPSLHTSNEPSTPRAVLVTKPDAQHSSSPAKTTQTIDPSTPVPTAPTTTVKPVIPVPVATTPATPKPTPVVVPTPGSSVSSLTPTPSSSSPPSSGSSSPPATTTSYSSSNWSGYMVTSGTFSAISGSWTATQATGNGTTTSADATWIGIGGVSTTDLIQVGTQNTISPSGHVSTSAFYELLPNSSETVPGVTVTAGDSMSASINKISGLQWNITITDNTNGQSYSSTVSYNSSESSAEWIEEDPSYYSGRQIPFDNFGTTYFNDGSTIDDGSPLNLLSSNADSITMLNTADQPVATPSALGSDGASFSVARNNF
jgi:hypothetical protein